MKLTRREFLKLPLVAMITKAIGPECPRPNKWVFPLSFPAYFVAHSERARMKRKRKIYLPLVKNG